MAPARTRKVPAAPALPVPPRPLGQEGTRTWERLWSLRRGWIQQDADLEHVLMLCESVDERTGLRVRVFRDNEWRDRVALRALDDQITDMIGRLGLTPADRERITTGEVPEHGRLAQLRSARP